MIGKVFHNKLRSIERNDNINRVIREKCPHCDTVRNVRKPYALIVLDIENHFRYHFGIKKIAEMYAYCENPRPFDVWAADQLRPETLTDKQDKIYMGNFI